MTRINLFCYQIENVTSVSITDNAVAVVKLGEVSYCKAYSEKGQSR